MLNSAPWLRLATTIEALSAFGWRPPGASALTAVTVVEHRETPANQTVAVVCSTRDEAVAWIRNQEDKGQWSHGYFALYTQEVCRGPSERGDISGVSFFNYMGRELDAQPIPPALPGLVRDEIGAADECKDSGHNHDILDPEDGGTGECVKCGVPIVYDAASQTFLERYTPKRVDADMYRGVSTGALAPTPDPRVPVGEVGHYRVP